MAVLLLGEVNDGELALDPTAKAVNAAMVLGDSHGAHSALASTPAARRRCPRQQLGQAR